MNTATFPLTDYSPVQCRDALVRFDEEILEEAIAVMTSGNDELIATAAQDRRLAPAIFWVREWSVVEGIGTRRRAIEKLKDIREHREARLARMRQMAMGAFIGIGTAGLAIHSISTLVF